MSSSSLRSSIRKSELLSLHKNNLGFSSLLLSHAEGEVNFSLHELWEKLRTKDKDSVSSEFLLGFLERSGISLKDDTRFAKLVETLEGSDKPLTPDDFAVATAGCIGLIKEVVSNDFVVSNFGALKQAIEEVYEAVLPNKSGANAGYIPQLKNADPEKFGISVCTVDGQQFSIGDTGVQFSIQSCSKPLSYLLALNEFGTDYVHKSVGMEPSGRAFNEICLKDVSVPGSGTKHSIPHNPMINAGAMMTCSMVYPEFSRQERLEKVIEFWKRLCGGMENTIGFSEETYKSESGCADQNWCLAYMMKEFNAFPECFLKRESGKAALEDTLELYFSICSILNTCRGMSIMAATLANGGINPITGETITSSQNVRQVLPLMLSSGMYDYSGQWAFDVGVPAKSGVGGCVFLVIPNVAGIAIFSPRLDQNGNSVRGVHVATELVKKLKIHNFETFSGLAHSKIDLRAPKYSVETKDLTDIMFAAANGDISSLSRYYASGKDITMSDYDKRTALHIAATEGQFLVVKFLVKKTTPEYLNIKDRWGTTALMDAQHYGWNDIINELVKAGCDEKEARPNFKGTDPDEDQTVVISQEAPILLTAAAAGDLDEVVKLHFSGVDLGVGDYDKRTLLHLAACENHMDIIKYAIANAKTGDDIKLIQAKDRWGNTALDDARHGSKDAVAYFEEILKGQ